MKNIALTGGGTGGHIYPLISIYKYFYLDKNLNFTYFGDQDGLEGELAFQNNINFIHIPSGKVRRYFDIRNFFEPLKNISGIFWGIYYIIFYKIDIIFSKGGYVSLPLCIAGFLLRKKIYIHESDSITGISNKFISKLATKIFYTFPNSKIDNSKHIFVGQILNPELTKYIDPLEIEENQNLEVLVIGGSLGSTKIFENIKNILDKLENVNFSVILGTQNLAFKNEFKKYKNIKIYESVTQKEIGEIYKKTDIAVTRAGSTTLWELYHFGIHSIIIPLPTSAQNHQKLNGLFFKEKFGSDLLEENDKLDIEIFKLIYKYKDLRKNGLNFKDMFSSLEKIKKEINL